MTKLTAAIIQTRGDDIKCEAGGPDNEGKYTGWITLYRKGELDRNLLNTPPVYNTEKEAVAAVTTAVEEVRNMPPIDIFKPLRTK